MMMPFPILLRSFGVPLGHGKLRWVVAALAVSGGLAHLPGCSYYDASLLSPAGDGPKQECESLKDCPAPTDECEVAVCSNGSCGTLPSVRGTPAGDFAEGDCRSFVCDGKRGIIEIRDDDDLPKVDACYVGICDNGTPDKRVAETGAICERTAAATEGGAGARGAGASLGGSSGEGETGVCDGRGLCVECVDESDCPIGLSCGDAFTCQSPSCQDERRNGGESDVDCGGATTCDRCDVGEDCARDTDCVFGRCDVERAMCACGGDHLLIGEVRTRGVAGGNDEFIELYNPTPLAITLGPSWRLEWRSAELDAFFATRWAADDGITIPPDGRWLLVGEKFAEEVLADGELFSGITDAGSLRLVNGTTIVDALCLHFSEATQTLLEAPDYGCEGASMSNTPHNNSSAGNQNVSVVRRPGTDLGSCQDTNVSAADFLQQSPATPESSGL